MALVTRRGAMGLIACGVGGGALGVRGALGQGSGEGGAEEGGARDAVTRRRLGRTDMTVSAVGFGGMTIALAQSEPDHVTRLLNEALDAGLNFIDTAECYGFPERRHSEELIGGAIGGRRDEYYLCSKVGHEHGVFAQEHEDWSAASIGRTIDRSLERLRTDRLDVAYLHGCGVDVLRAGEATGALERAREAGKVRYLGYSGGGERNRVAIESGAFDVVQVTLNVFDQGEIEGSIALARARGMGVVVKRPLGNAVWRYKQRPEWWYYQEYWDRMGALGYDFLAGEALKDPGPRGAGGVALRFVAWTPGVHSAIVGTRSVGRWSQNNANVAAGALGDERYEEIRARWREVVGAAEAQDADE